MLVQRFMLHMDDVGNICFLYYTCFFSELESEIFVIQAHSSALIVRGYK